MYVATGQCDPLALVFRIFNSCNFWGFDSPLSGDSVRLGNDAASHVICSKYKECSASVSNDLQFRKKKLFFKFVGQENLYVARPVTKYDAANTKEIRIQACMSDLHRIRTQQP
jgi:hypothetical protein